MSDNHRRYRAILRALKQCYPGVLSGRMSQHLTVLAAFISGIVGSKCLCKINFILPSKILNHPFHIIDEIAPAVIGAEVNPFVLHKTPQDLY